MKSPRDASMVVAAIVSAALVVGLASITSGGAVASLARSTDAGSVVQVDADAGAATSGPDDATAPAEAEEASRPSVTVDPDATVETTGSELSVTDVVTPSDVHTSREDAQALADQVGAETGRTVVLVFQERSLDGRATTWTHTDVPGRSPFVASDEDALVSRVTAWIDAQDDPEAFELIVDE